MEKALPLLDGVQFVMAAAHGRESRLHLGIEDTSIDSAIVEYVEGEPKIYHDRRFVMMTNSPGYDEQLQFLATQDFSNPSSDMPLPGNVNPRDRFQRGAYYRAILPEPQSQREAVASLLSVVRNVSVPYGAPYKGMGVYNTGYRTVINITGRRYYFELTNSPSLVWVDLNKLNFSEGAPVLMLDPDNIDLCGDVSGALELADAPF